MERALLVTIEFENKNDGWPIQDVALELEELALAAGAEVIDNILCRRLKPTPNLLIGSGKVEEIKYLCFEEKIDTVIFSQDLSGVQQRNLEEIVGTKTIDRTQLILDIFAQRAKTPEGKMQVELAQLQYLLPRLIGKGIMLSRLGGGIGTRGPGEQKLEVDRRRIKKRIDKLTEDLRKLRIHRDNLRKQRKKKAIPQVALVGYTNAGKSTLLNSLTQAGQLVSERLFTTLDPISRLIKLPNGEKIIISDTVGFLHELPHHLIEAFKATLEEVSESDIIIHLLDAANPKIKLLALSVKNVLNQLQVENKPLIIALNKIDLLAQSPIINELLKDFPGAIPISAKTKENLNGLLSKVAEILDYRMTEVSFAIPLSRMDLVDLLYREGKVQKIDYSENEIRLEVKLPWSIYHRLKSEKGPKQIG